MSLSSFLLFFFFSFYFFLSSENDDGRPGNPLLLSTTWGPGNSQPRVVVVVVLVLLLLFLLFRGRRENLGPPLVFPLFSLDLKGGLPWKQGVSPLAKFSILKISRNFAKGEKKNLRQSHTTVKSAFADFWKKSFSPKAPLRENTFSQNFGKKNSPKTFFP